ncbi:MAG: hypothetical protein AVDCRST_MAG35-1768, partial [uncultured Quadrisphaera sp.]
EALPLRRRRPRLHRHVPRHRRRGARGRRGPRPPRPRPDLRARRHGRAGARRDARRL